MIRGTQLWSPAVCALALAIAGTSLPAHEVMDGTSRIAVVSAFEPELAVLAGSLQNSKTHTLNGVEFHVGELDGKDVVLFLSGISIVNAAMTSQLALDHFRIKSIIFSGIAGGVDPSLNIGDVVVVERWGQYFEVLLARQVGEQFEPIPHFSYPFDNYGMMFPRELSVRRSSQATPTTLFWFPVDENLLATARTVAGNVSLNSCTKIDNCLEEAPKFIVGGTGVSGSAFVDNADFRKYAFDTFGARVLDMESAAVAHVAWSNDVPFLAVRSLSDLAGGGPGENKLEVFWSVAAENSAAIVRSLLRALPD